MGLHKANKKTLLEILQNDCGAMSAKVWDGDIEPDDDEATTLPVVYENEGYQGGFIAFDEEFRFRGLWDNAKKIEKYEEKTYRPFTREEILDVQYREVIVENSFHAVISGILLDGDIIKVGYSKIGRKTRTYIKASEALEQLVFLDGSPFGVEVNND